MLNFGKHKGKSYIDMLENEKSYCVYVLNQTECSGIFKEFQNFLKKNNDKLYDVNELTNVNDINCSELTNYMSNDNNVINIIKDININTINKAKINRTDEIEPSLFGQFIDYLVRYEISKISNIQFRDMRTESIIKFPEEYCELQNLVCESLCMNLDEIENLNDDIINELVKNSDKDITKIKKIINNYKNKINEHQFIKDSYLKLQNNNNVLLIDVLNISISHSLFFGRKDDINYKNYKQEIINKKSYENIIDYTKEKTNNKKNILLNPTLGNRYLGISADADLIIDTELIDMKISKYIGLNINDFIQLIVYATLYYLQTNIICEKISIYNPILGKENYIMINIDIIKKFISILENYNIGNRLEKNKLFTFITPSINDINQINCNELDLVHIINFIANNDNIEKYKLNKKNGSKWKKIEKEYNKILNELLNNAEKTYNINGEYRYEISWNKYLRSLQLEIYPNPASCFYKKLSFVYNNELKLKA